MRHTIKRSVMKFLAVALAGAGLFSLAEGCGTAKIGKEPAVREEITVTIPGMQGEVKLLYLSDLHIATVNDQISEADFETVKIRAATMARNGIPAEKLWNEWVGYINSSKADYVLFGADMVDCAAKKNIEVLEAGLDKLTVPYMYIRADHDSAPYYLNGVTDADCKALQDAVCDNSDVMVKDFSDFLVVGWNNSTSNLSDEGLKKIKEVCGLDKPIILLTHVPIESLKDVGLAQASREVFADRSLLWGVGDNYYWPDGNTKELLNIIYAEDSPVKEILCGHLHFTWDGYVTDSVHEHVFSPAFSGYVGVVTVKGE